MSSPLKDFEIEKVISISICDKDTGECLATWELNENGDYKLKNLEKREN